MVKSARVPPSKPSEEARQYDLIVFGATSFVGQILSRYLFERQGADGVRWALAGRSEPKLAQLRASLGAGAEAIPLVVADASDAAAMAALCQQTKVVVSTVGPYALYGNELVAACVQTGTDYCDLTGEVQWIHRMIAQHEDAAKKTGARIVHCCGFDSIPSDLGVHFLQAASRKRHGVPAERVKLRIKAMRGGASGGTVASLMNVMKEVAADPSLRKVLGNPYALAPAPGASRPRNQPNVQLGEFDPQVKTWLAPFVMAAINTRIVHRSNQLSDFAYGEGFTYDEAMTTGPGLKGQFIANGIALALGGFVGLAAVKPTRSLLERFVVPKPGEGPTPEAQKNGFFDFRFYGTTASGDVTVTKVTGDRDPGYGSTGKMLGEAAVCLARDIDKSALGGGFWTPATAMGDALIERLVAHAGLTFEVL